MQVNNILAVKIDEQETTKGVEDYCKREKVGTVFITDANEYQCMILVDGRKRAKDIQTDLEKLDGVSYVDNFHVTDRIRATQK